MSDAECGIGPRGAPEASAVTSVIPHSALRIRGLVMSATKQTTKAAQGAPKRGKAKGQRPKHVPQRTCVACREIDAKRGLIRLVRTPEGTVDVDPTGKRAGRG